MIRNNQYIQEQNAVEMSTVIEKLRSENAKLREALEFYGDEKNWKWIGEKWSYEGEFKGRSGTMVDDKGAKAREALK